MADFIREKEIVTEYIDDEGNYVKAKGRKVEQIGFYLRFIHDHFIPCKECQKELLRKIRNASEWTLGNKEYDPLIELWKKFDIDDEAWEEVERRKATKEEIERL